jgi:hypothetical protein
MRSSLGYWRRLPYDLCLRRQQQQEVHSQCWNGTAVAPYTRTIASEGQLNPEVEAEGAEVRRADNIQS